MIRARVKLLFKNGKFYMITYAMEAARPTFSLIFVIHPSHSLITSGCLQINLSRMITHGDWFMLNKSSWGSTFHGTGGGGGGPPSWICDVTSGRHLGFVVTSLPVAILDLWSRDLWSRDFRSRDFRSRDFLSRDFRTGNHVTGNDVPQIQDGDRKWRHHKFKMATGSDVTNPRWRTTTSTTRPTKCATQVLAKVSLERLKTVWPRS